MRTDIEQLTHDHPVYETLREHAESGPDWNSYKIVTLNEGKFVVTDYKNRPCFGEMRPYHKTHPKEVNDKVSMPGDLHIRFPDGNPVGYAIHQSHWVSNDAAQFLLNSDESPFRSVFSLAEKIRDKNNKVMGLVFLDLDLDPTLLVHGLRLCKGLDNKRFNGFVKAGATLPEAFALLHTGPFYWSSYYWSDRNNLKRVVEGNPINHSVNHKSYIDRAVYNRPLNERTFDDGQNMIGKVLNVPEFNKSSAEGQVKFLRSVLETMK